MKMPGPAIRRARVSDAPALARVQRASVRGLAREAYSPRQIAVWARLGPLYHLWALTAGREVAFVAEAGGRILGFASVKGGEVTAVFVRPAAAGRGIGSALLARVEAEARRRGARRLVVKASLNGLPFYRARGYRGRRRIRVPLPDGESLEAVLLSKALPAARAAGGVERAAPRASR